MLHRRRRLHLEAISSSLLGDQSRYRFGLLRRLLNPSGEARLSHFAQQRSLPSGNLSVSPSLFCRPHSTGKAIIVKLHSPFLLFYLRDNYLIHDLSFINLTLINTICTFVILSVIDSGNHVFTII